MGKEIICEESIEPTKPLSTYHEKSIGKTLFRVTTIYKKEVDFKKTIEDSIIKRIVNDEISRVRG